LFFVLCIIVIKAQSIRGVRKKDLQEYLGTSFSCKDKSKTVPSSYVNDQFCDCEDGSDEPGTSACVNGQFWCVNKGFRGSSIYSSRVNDGICDCCDGSDEQDGVCRNYCDELGQVVQKGVLKEIQLVEEGIAARQKLIEEGRSMRETKEKELEKLREELKIKEQEIEAAKVIKDKEEEVERIERERIEAINLAASKARAAKAESAASSTPSTGNENTDPSSTTTSPSSTSSPETSTTDHVDKKESDTVTVDVPAFPYPEQYAFKPSTEETKEKFPYPEQYRAPETETNKEKEKESNVLDGAENALNSNKETQSGSVDTKPEIIEDEELEKYQSESADKARKTYDDIDSSKKDIQNKITKLEQWLKQDFGPEGEFATMHGKCYSTTVRQYTYEVCAYEKAEQKENNVGTSLGTWDGWKDEAEVGNLGFKVDQLAYNKVMKFHNGQSCWQGPQRSLTVRLKCAANVELSQVEEPNKCVYTAHLSTPAVCTSNQATYLRNNLEQNKLFEED